MEKIKIKLKLHSITNKGPSFRILINDYCHVNETNCQASSYEKNLYLENLFSDKNKLTIEHYNKHPKDTDIKLKQDVAVELESLWFNNIKVSAVDLYLHDFTVTKWKYPVQSPIRNSLYFGYNGYYTYYFTSPITTHALSVHKKHQINISNEAHKLDNINEQQFIEKLKIQLESEKNMFSKL